MFKIYSFVFNNGGNSSCLGQHIPFCYLHDFVWIPVCSKCTSQLKNKHMKGFVSITWEKIINSGKGIATVLQTDCFVVIGRAKNTTASTILSDKSFTGHQTLGLGWAPG